MKVELLEATNRRLEREIQEELKRRSPTEMKELDGLLRSASFLQEQIGDCLTARGLLNLQLLACELAIFDLNSRCEQEREQRGRVEADLGDLRYLHEVLKFHKLPELQEVLREQRQELQELQERHLQDEQALLNQVSGGVAVAMQTAESSDLIQQLDVLRQISAAESWTEVPILQAPDVTFDLAASSEVAELEHLRRTSTNLTEDLKHLQRETAVLEASGRQQTENFMVQLTVLQETADHLCLDLDSVLQAAAQQAADHQALLDVKSRLEAEIQDYMRLLDSLSHQG
ncbi:keratin, type I cytoskeletal 16-like [Salarias fasciatus]|uniref:keratin, type I cytoskeletal 16-like n=1 Tax=Salarias fasciatus TaxID=181472 RepID=UPI0011769D6B|nr:keratin, type I cytoskeletal 16-like [Salarias fasciatus]